jgi:hypothetical protein
MTADSAGKYLTREICQADRFRTACNSEPFRLSLMNGFGRHGFRRGTRVSIHPSMADCKVVQKMRQHAWAIKKIDDPLK